MPQTPIFTPELFVFLQELEENNHKTWWDAHKDRYEQHVRGAALRFVAAMAEPLARFAPAFEAVPKKVGGSVMRPQRDTRFSADKTPYKTNLGIQFRHRRGKDVHGPGFYVHLSAEELFLGVGVWHPEPAALAAIRQGILERPAEWVGARDAAVTAGWKQAGESLKRPPRGVDPAHPLADDLRRKDHIVSVVLEVDDVLDADFVEHVAERFAATAPYVRFQCAAMGLELD